MTRWIPGFRVVGGSRDVLARELVGAFRAGLPDYAAELAALLNSSQARIRGAIDVRRELGDSLIGGDTARRRGEGTIWDSGASVADRFAPPRPPSQRSRGLAFGGVFDPMDPRTWEAEPSRVDGNPLGLVSQGPQEPGGPPVGEGDDAAGGTWIYEIAQLIYELTGIDLHPGDPIDVQDGGVERDVDNLPPTGGRMGRTMDGGVDGGVPAGSMPTDEGGPPDALVGLLIRNLGLHPIAGWGARRVTDPNRYRPSGDGGVGWARPQIRIRGLADEDRRAIFDLSKALSRASVLRRMWGGHGPRPPRPVGSAVQVVRRAAMGTTRQPASAPFVGMAAPSASVSLSRRKTF